jgi:hypothetical protein
MCIPPSTGEGEVAARGHAPRHGRTAAPLRRNGGGDADPTVGLDYNKMLMAGGRGGIVEAVMSRTALGLIIAAAALALPAEPAAAAITIYNAQLSGTNEVPPNASPGTGFVIVTIDDDGVFPTMRVQATFADLIAGTVASHIHCCDAPGVNAPVATTVPSFFGFPFGVTSGTYDNTFDMTLATSYNPTFIAAHGGTTESAFADLLAGLNAGEAYFNIHTSQFAGGEIRGQLAAVPEPSTWMLMIGGFGLLGVALRWRRRGRVLAVFSGNR